MEILAARWYGCPSPGYFDALPKEERVDIIAAYEASWKMDAINGYEGQQEAERAARKAARKRH